MSMTERPDLLNNSPSPRVLVVEDDPVSSMLVQRLFAAQGVTVDVAPNGAVALEKQRECSYRLVVSDWVMPEMDGVELCRQFRKLDGPYVYFILFSSRGQREDRREAFEAGVDDFLSKPLDRDELRGRLKVARRILAMEEDLQAKNSELERTTEALSNLNEHLRLASERFEGLFDGLPVACFTFGHDGRIGEWNDQASQVFELSAADALGRPVWELWPLRGDSPWEPDKVRELFADGRTGAFDWSFPATDGTNRYLATSVICLPNVAQRTVSAVCANLDITERKTAEQRINEYAEMLEAQTEELERMNARLNHLAVTDGLTGLWNQRRFFELLEETVHQHDRSGSPFSLILCDIDYFKRVNDALGHQAGDEVLREFADVLRYYSRGHELPARYGGEEFAIILRECDAEAGLAAAERFRRALELNEWVTHRVTGSFGVATSEPGNTTPRSILAEADKALYASKSAGRNCSTHVRDINTSPRNR